MTDEIAEDEPFAPFERWFALATTSEPLAETMTLATATRDGMPSLRAVLLKGADPRGFVFYTNFASRKAEELFANPRAALCFHWKSLGRQIRIEGTASIVSDDEANAYFASRPRDSQIGAWASDQSRPLAERGALEARFAEVARQYAGSTAVPRPDYWSGFRIRPERVEFWQERPFRLHDRVLFTRDGEAWRKTRLFP
ncbi:MAG: pyridoxamine 5'-phosphate oxidase [Alphaproteobacteria bacterium]|nr:MAG: pyridoxamine 5'-phosphate oxidase [Alphaproteobacteria bacterium]